MPTPLMVALTEFYCVNNDTNVHPISDLWHFKRYSYFFIADALRSGSLFIALSDQTLKVAMLKVFFALKKVWLESLVDHFSHNLSTIALSVPC